MPSNCTRRKVTGELRSKITALEGVLQFKQIATKTFFELRGLCGNDFIRHGLLNPCGSFLCRTLATGERMTNLLGANRRLIVNEALGRQAYRARGDSFLFVETTFIFRDCRKETLRSHSQVHSMESTFPTLRAECGLDGSTTSGTTVGPRLQDLCRQPSP